MPVTPSTPPSLRQSARASWADVSNVLGVTRQTAHSRYRHHRRDPDSQTVWVQPPLPLIRSRPARLGHQAPEPHIAAHPAHAILIAGAAIVTPPT